MNDNDLPDALSGSLPARPDTTGWADAARAKARNRRLAAGATAVALVAAVMVPLALRYTGAPTVVASTAPSPSSAAPSTESPTQAPIGAEKWIPDACLEPDNNALPLVDDRLPGGATQLWLCGTNPSAGWLVGTVGAPDPLTTGIDRLVSEFNAMGTQVGVAGCLPSGFDYSLVIEYPDGFRKVRTDGCGFLRDATDMDQVFREDGLALLDTVEGLWAAERSETGFTFQGTDVCDFRALPPRGTVPADQLTRAVACGSNPVEVPAELAERLIGSFAAVEGDISIEPLLGGPPDLVFLTPAGSPVSLVGPSVVGFMWSDHQSKNRGWPIPDDLMAELQAYLDQANTSPDPNFEPLPDEPLVGLEPEVCADVRSGALQPSALDDGEPLPTGAARAWLCGDLYPSGTLGPMEPLTHAPDRVAEMFNSLPVETPGACTEIGGPIYAVVVDYPDGTRRVLTSETVNCEVVTGGRVGGQAFVEDLVTLWEQQRAVSPTLFDADVSLCGPVGSDGLGFSEQGSVMPPVPRSEFHRAVACGRPAESEDSTAAPIEVELPPELVVPMSTAALETGPETSPSWPSGLPIIVFLNTHGDPVTGYVGPNASGVRFQEGVWIPTADQATLLREVLSSMDLNGF